MIWRLSRNSRFLVGLNIENSDYVYKMLKDETDIGKIVDSSLAGAHSRMLIRVGISLLAIKKISNYGSCG